MTAINPKARNAITVDAVIVGLLGIYIAVINFAHTIALHRTALGVATILACWSCYRRFKAAPFRSWPPFSVLFALWLMVALLSLSVSDDRWYSLDEIKKEVVFGIISFWLFYYFTRSRGDLFFYCTLVIIGGVVTLIQSIYSYTVLDYTVSVLQSTGRLYGKPHYYSFFIYVVTIVSFVIAAQADMSRRLRVLMILIVILSVPAQYFSEHRAGYVAVFVAVLLGGYLLINLHWGAVTLKTKLLLWVVIIATGFVGSVLVMDKKLQWESGLKELSDISNSSAFRPRIKIWDYFIREKLAARPLSGYGFGNKFDEVSTMGNQGFYPHNIILSYAVMMGIPGAVVLVALFVRLFGLFRRNLIVCGRAQWNDYVIALGGLLILIGFVIQNMTDDIMVRHVGVFFWSLMGMFLGYARSVSDGQRS